MGKNVAKAKKILGNVTEDRDVEAQGRSEETIGHKPDTEEVIAVKDQIQQARGETHQAERDD